MPQSTSVSGRVTHTVADLTGRTDEEIRLLMGVAVAGVAVAATHPHGRGPDEPGRDVRPPADRSASVE